MSTANLSEIGNAWAYRELWASKLPTPQFIVMSGNAYRRLRKSTLGGIPTRRNPRRSYRDQSRYRFKSTVV